MSEETAIAILTPEQVAEHKQAAQKIFDDYDVDKNGLINVSEVENVFRKWRDEGSFPSVTDNQIKDLGAQFFKQADENADAKVTFDEVYNVVLRQGGICFHLVL